MRGLGALFYGIPGIGKTTFALQAPKPLTCISIHETGFDDLEAIGDVPEGTTGMDVTKFESLLMILDMFIQATNAPKTIVLDTLSGLQQIYFEWLIQRAYSAGLAHSLEDAKKNFWAFYKGPRMEAPSEFPILTSRLTSLLKKGTHVFLLSHKRVDIEEDVVGPDVKKAVIDMDDGIRSSIQKWAPNILYMTIAPTITTVTKTGPNQSIVEGKAAMETNRIMFTTTNPTNDAKNKLKLPTVLSLGKSPQEAFGNFWNLVPDSYKH